VGFTAACFLVGLEFLGSEFGHGLVELVFGGREDLFAVEVGLTPCRAVGNFRSDAGGDFQFGGHHLGFRCRGPRWCFPGLLSVLVDRGRGGRRNTILLAPVNSHGA